MRRFLIGTLGLVAVAAAFTLPTSTAEAHSPYVACRPHAARVYHPHYYRGCAPVVRPAYRPAVVVPPTARNPFWHYPRHCR